LGVRGGIGATAGVVFSRIAFRLTRVIAGGGRALNESADNIYYYIIIYEVLVLARFANVYI